MHSWLGVFDGFRKQSNDPPQPAQKARRGSEAKGICSLRVRLPQPLQDRLDGRLAAFSVKNANLPLAALSCS
jgi:hypothetical protein